MKISVNQNPYYAVKSYHISPDLHTNRNCRISAQPVSVLWSTVYQQDIIWKAFCAEHVHLKQDCTEMFYCVVCWQAIKQIIWTLRCFGEIQPIIPGGGSRGHAGTWGPSATCLQVRWCMAVGWTATVKLCVAAQCAMAHRALQPWVPPYRYPTARHHALLIYCYTGFHN